MSRITLTVSMVMAIVIVALAGAVFGPAATDAQGQGTTTYKVEMTRIDGDRSSVAGVQAADKVQVNPGNACDDITVTVPAGSADSAILAAADAKSSCHSINTGSRYIDASGDVHNFQSGARTYWLIVKQATTPPPTPAPTPTPGPTADYTVTHVQVDGPRNSAQAVKDANKTASGTSSGHHEFTLAADATTAAILAAANARSTHSITTDSRYIDANGNVHNFQSGKRTYWLITKSEVNVVEPTPTPGPQNVGANLLTLTGTIADQELAKGVAYTGATAFPEAGGVDGTVTYSVANLPTGITLNADRKLTGTATAVLVETQLTYTATDTDTDTATLTFKLSVSEPVDYDADNDGLIEVANLAQLNALRWDLDGDGSRSDSGYDTAFPAAASGMGCPINATDADDNDCIGYELTDDLDFDTNGDGVTNVAGDTYWNNNAGWTPIGVFTAEFEGNGYTISNLFVWGPATNAGLFDGIGAGGEVRNLGLTGVGVTTDNGKLAGGIAGTLSGDAQIKNSHVTGAVSANGSNSKAGGLAGSMTGSAQILKSYAAGTVSSTGSATRAGGLTGTLDGTTEILNSYATASVSATGATPSAGGLAAYITGTAQVQYSYATGAVSSTGANRTVGGLLAAKSGGTIFTDSYWDTGTTGQTTSPGGGTAKNTGELQGPTSAAGIYTSWAAADWDFGTANHYPTLKADWDGDGTATAAEFGDQLIDYDADDDGLIEVDSLGQFDAIRYDLDGNGAAASGNDATNYAAVFPMFQAGMGCNEDAATDDAKVCIGYELTADLDFDTNDDGKTNVTGDAYWNSGAGWTPIGGAFAADFDGNGHTISNLFININSSSPDGYGLFDSLGSGGTIKRVGIDGGSVTSVGAGTHNTGGLAGLNDAGTIEFSYSSATISSSGNGGGLVGSNINGGIIRSSYATGAVSGNIVGGLVGNMFGLTSKTAQISDSYATGAISSTGPDAKKNEGGLVKQITFGHPATITNSYSTGGDKLIATKGAGATVTASYWDSTKGAATVSTVGGDPKTTTELQTPTSNTGIYAAWSADEWDFRDANNIPLLKADFNGDGTATWQEFGDQDPEPAFAADASIAQVLTAKDVAYTSANALPEATGGNLPITYSATGLPASLLLNTARKITGTPTAYQLFTDVTYTATDADGDTDTLTFKLGVGPAETTLTATAGNGQVALSWTAIADVSRWGYTQTDGTTTHPAVPNSSGATTSYTVSGLTNGTEYTFGVYAIAVVDNDYINGAASNPVVVTPLGSLDKVPVLGAVDDQLYVQGAAVNFTLPEATGGDGHPNYAYTLSMASDSTKGVSDIGLSFDQTTPKITGTPTLPAAKATYRYAATELSDPDGTEEFTAKTFTIGIQPKQPTNFTATAGTAEVTLAWTAIAGVAKWQVKLDSGSFTDISSSGASTNSHTVTGLANGTEYTFKVRALVGDSSASPSTQVIGVESDAKSATPLADLIPILTDIADQTYLQGAAVDFTLPAASSGDPPFTYTLTPDVSGIGLTFTASTHKLSGTPSTPRAKVTYTYTATESSDSDNTNESASKTFTIGIQPKKPTGFTVASGNGQVTLSWDAITGVDDWGYKQASGGGTAAAHVIDPSDANTSSHIVTGLTNGTEYTFKVAASVGTGDSAITGLESDSVKATPSLDLIPALPTVADQTYVQGAAVDFTLPSATGGDSHPSYAYTLTPDVSGIGLTFTASTHKLSGTPSTPNAKVAYTYTATETTDSDNTVESASKTFTIGIQPQKPANLTATADSDNTVTLSWTAIAGVSGWQVKQDSGGWTDISGSGPATSSHTVTGLAGETEYTFKVRALVGTGAALVEGVESDAASATTLADRAPSLADVTDQVYGQGEAVNFTLPAATGGDGHPSYTYTLTPGLPEGLTFSASTRRLTGTPSAPSAKITYTYTATETSDSDGVNESASKTFTIGVQPKQPGQLSARNGALEVHLYWSAIAGVDGWEYSQDGGSWTAFDRGTRYFITSHTVTGLTAGTEYEFQVRAFAGSGDTRVDGPASDTVRATPDTSTRPREPELPDAEAGDGQATLTWTAMSGVTGWEYWQVGTYHAQNGIEVESWIAMSGSSATTNSFTLTGLTNGTTYRFQVRAVNGTEKGVESDTIFVIPQAQ